MRSFYLVLMVIVFTGCSEGDGATPLNPHEIEEPSSQEEQEISQVASDQEESVPTNDENESALADSSRDEVSNSNEGISGLPTEIEDTPSVSEDESEVESTESGQELDEDLSVVNTLEENVTSEEEESSQGKAQLGVLAGATVKLYELNGINQKLLATQKTTLGDTIAAIGNFDIPFEKLEDNTYYLYEVSGGEDFDVEDDGIVNEVSTPNYGVIHLLAKGSSIKAIQDIRVTIVSEIVYQNILPFLGEPQLLEEQLKKLAQEIVQSDINGDGFVGREDILRFNPIQHKNNLFFNYQEKFDLMILNILEGRSYNDENNASSGTVPKVGDISLTVDENVPVGTVIGKVNLLSEGDSKILKYILYESNAFSIDSDGNINIVISPDYESKGIYNLNYSAFNSTGESSRAQITIYVQDIVESPISSGGNPYPINEDGIQTALDSADYNYVLNQLLNNSDAYNDMNEDEVNMNIAGAYVGISGYTVYDIVEAVSSSEENSFNGFVASITQENDTVSTLKALLEADNYYSEIVDSVDCGDTDSLSDEQQVSCFNLGLVRLTSLSNSVKLLFGGDADVVESWANGVETNTADDLNGNGVIDEADASACAIVYASAPQESCSDGTMHTYRGRVVFSKLGVDYNTTLLEIDVGSAEHGYHSFYKLTTNKLNNNSPILTNGICDRNFNTSSSVADGVNYFPCPTLDSDGKMVGLKEQLEIGADIQSLFPDGSETQTTIENYINNITGSPDGTIGLDNLSDYLQRQ